MGHVTPVLAIPVGGFFVVMGSWAALAPEQFPHDIGRMRLLSSLLGRTGATEVLRAGGIVMAAGSTWLVVHTAVALFGS